MNAFKSIAGAAVVAALACGGAEAKVWDFNYSGGGYSASGEFITGDAGSPYAITAVSGTADGYAITGLSSYANADQSLYYPAVDGSYASFSGISFINANGVAYNISNYPSGNNLAISTLDTEGYGSAQVAIALTVTPGQDAAIPESSTWAMMVLGFASLAMAGYRARRAGTAVA